MRLRKGLSYVLLGTVLFVAASLTIVLGIGIGVRLRQAAVFLVTVGGLGVALAGLNVLLGTVYCLAERHQQVGRGALAFSLMLQLAHLGIIVAHYATRWPYLGNRYLGWFALLPPALFLMFLAELASEHGDEELAGQTRQLGVICVAAAAAAAVIVFFFREADWFHWAYLSMAAGGVAIFSLIAWRIRQVQRLVSECRATD